MDSKSRLVLIPIFVNSYPKVHEEKSSRKPQEMGQGMIKEIAIGSFSKGSKREEIERVMMKYEFLSRNEQTELPVRRQISCKRVTGVVPATTPPMPKLEQKSNS